MIINRKRFFAISLIVILAASTAITIHSCHLFSKAPPDHDVVSNPSNHSSSPLTMQDGMSAPALAVGAHSATLIWSKPDDYTAVKDYAVYENGRFLADASKNMNSPAEPYFQSFYTDPSNNNAERISKHTFVVTKLAPDTAYTFSVKAIYANDSETPVGNAVSVTTRHANAPLNVLSFGAKGDGTTLDTSAIQKAINACGENGTVILPKDKTFLSGPLQLKSNMTLDVDGTLLGSPSASCYQTTGSSKARPLLTNEISANRSQNIRIVGNGTINGDGWKTAPSESTNLLSFQKGDDKTVNTRGILASSEYECAIAHLGCNSTKAYAWRSNILSFQKVDGLYIGGGLVIANPPQHVLTVNDCSDVILNSAKIESYNCNNGDGIDFSNSKGLTVMNSVFDTGDDSVNFNAGYGEKGEKEQPAENIWVFDNYFGHGHGAVVAGSGTAAGIKNVLAEDNVIVGSGSGLRCKSSKGNGGGAQNIVFRDSALKNINEEEGEPFIFTSLYPKKRGITAASDGPIFQNITVENCTVNTASGSAIFVAGLSSAWHQNLTFKNISFTNTKAASLTYLKNSTFSKVTSSLGNSFFKTSNTQNLQFTDTIS